MQERNTMAVSTRIITQYGSTFLLKYQLDTLQNKSFSLSIIIQTELDCKVTDFSY